MLILSHDLISPEKYIMGEDDIVELLGKSSQVVTSSQTQTPSCDPPLILRGSGSGDGEGNGPLPQPPPPLYHQQSLFIQEDEMASWLHQPNRQDYLYSQLLYSGVASTHPQSLASLEPPPPPRAQYILAADRPTGHILAERRAENFMNISRQRGNIFLGGVEAVPSNSTLLSSATESIPATHGTESRATVTGGVSRTFAVPGLGPRGKAVAIETAGTQSWGLCKAETEPVQRQPATETDITDERKRKTREETNVENQGTEEARDSTSSKRSRAAIMHKLSERRRRQKINEMMKALQELLPRCTKTDRSSMLDDVIEYVKSLQSQIQGKHLRIFRS